MEIHVDVGYIRFDPKDYEFFNQQYFTRLPLPLQLRNLQYRTVSSSILHLLGNILLEHLSKVTGCKSGILNDISVSKYGRPFIKYMDIDFNKSHTEGCVICAIGKNIRVGVDVEKVAALNFDDFTSIMTQPQWKKIYSAENQLRTFYEYWCIKESMIKADGRGLSVPLETIKLEDDMGFIDTKQWFLHKLELGSEYVSCLCVDQSNFTLKVQELDCYNL